MRFILTSVLLLMVFTGGTLPAQTNFAEHVSDAAISIIDPSIIYNPSYESIDYPGGDIESGNGVCSDVVIRTFRELGIDLQKRMVPS